MAPITDPMGEEGLRFFGRTTASVTHELKNALAIIRENAGLLNDYMAMADQGKPVDPARMKTAAGRIEDQVLRADRLIKSLNQYAHAVDDHCKEIDLNTLLALFEMLSRRQAAMKQVALECAPAPAPVMVTTAPFFLLAALGHCLSFALTLSGPGERIRIEISAPPAKVIHILLPEGFDAAALEKFPDDRQKELLARLEVTVTATPADGGIAIRWNGG